jgi:hypothetical protein
MAPFYGGTRLPLRSQEGISWLLLDNFPTDLAAGSVNGTSPEVGGPRVVTDAQNLLSLSGGIAALAPGDYSWFNPILKWQAFTRTPGRMLIAELNVAPGVGDDSQYGTIGFINASGQVSGYYYLYSDLYNVDKNPATVGSGPSVAVLSQPGIGKYAVILRTTGHCLLKKDILDSNWFLSWISSTLSDASVTPSISQCHLTCTSSFFRIPQDLWLPTPLSSDGFGGTFPTTDGLGHAEGVAGGLGAGGAGQTWLTGTGATWSLSGGKLVNTPGTGAENLAAGNFDDAGLWTCEAGWDVNVTNPSKATSDGTESWLKNPVGNVAVVDQWYRLTFDVVKTGGAALSPFMAGLWLPVISASGAYVATGRAATTGSVAIFSSSLAGTVDNLSQKPLSLPDLLCTTLHTTAKVLASVDITRSVGLQAGIAVNWNSPTAPTDGIISYLSGASNGAGAEAIKTDEVVAGVYTNKGSTAVTYAAAAKMVVVKESATSMRVFYNNAAVGAAITVTSNNGLYHGVFSTGEPTEVSFDNWACYARGNEGQYAYLDRFIN